MRIVHRDIIDAFKKKYSSSRKPLDIWISEVSEVEWKNTADMKKMYPHASILPYDRVIFNIKANDYRLSVVVIFFAETITIEWVGTHAEYDKMDFTGIKPKRKK